MDQSIPIIPSMYVFSYLELLELFDYSVEELSKICRVPLPTNFNDVKPLSIEDALKVVAGAYELTDLPSLGLFVGHSLKPTCHGLAGIAVMTQPTFGESLKVASRLCEQAFPPFFMDYFERENQVGLRIFFSESLKPFEAFFLESVTLNFYNILHYIHGAKSEPDYIAFPYSAPKYVDLYKKFMNCDVRFNAPCCEYVVSRDLAEAKLPLANSQIATVAEQDFRRSIPAENLNSLKRKLRQVFMRKVGCFPSLDEAANELGMSGRTLRRQLHNLGSNFQNELDLVRKEVAIQLLMDNEKGITDVALSLGFYDSSAFSKLFKKWTGASPSEYRRQISK